jgi:hypothetical protein
MTTFTVCIGADIVVVGRDPEMADIDNPNGYRYGYSAYVVLEDQNGRRWIHSKKFVKRWEDDAMAAAAPFLHAVQVHLDAGGEIRFEFWTETDPAYGSIAYQSQGTEQYRALLERQQG